MRISTFVAIALFIMVFLVGSVFLINFIKTPLFLYIYFAFSLVLLIVISSSLKKAYPEQIKFSFLIIFIVFIAVALTLFGISVKAYSDNSKNIDIASIDNLKATNDYYKTYVDFLNSEILKTLEQSMDLQKQIDNLTSQNNLANQAANLVANQTPATTQDNAPIIIPREDRESEQDD